ncbi:MULTISPECIES: pilus assembly protein TadG-related protein [unclassified Massilia]|uniref:TadE/TadG family type IV pilus assembly protein n=1 Tax=unclassified Massilia TaxID=2609279 RepID=UPI00177D2901|nr:pilus assembly protein TadE [Massilia sp. CFBP 13647]MBD8672763.1 pilus assembly protein TadE [Massilia sp. CFBP 13721]
MSTETIKQTSSATRRQRRFRRKGSQDGAIAIMTAFVIVIMIAMFGMALDLSRSYNRKAELQNAADAAALVAAATLDGTPQGIDRAVTEAGATAENSTFAYNTDSVTWDNAALKFATGADGGTGGWMDAATAKATASTIFFAQVDTSALDSRHGNIQNFFMPILSPALAKTDVAASAIAGRDSLNALPLAICANSNTPAAPLSSGELVEYGFRRGVTYNLMNLNPGGQSPENFLLNPIAPSGTVGTAMKNRMDVVGPFICTGKMAIPTLQGGEVTVERGFPIDPLYVQLNSRFGTVAPCQSSTAPADPVVKSFDLASATWMKDKPDNLSANSLAAPDPLLTVAEKPDGATNTAYGALWTYAKAVPYSAYASYGAVEPAKGYSTYKDTDWGLLYSPGLPQAKSYPNTPYQAAGGSATYKLGRNTRVLHIPLLSCPVPAGALSTATVVGIAKFFMMIPASSSALYAEFAGMTTETALGGNARLYR